MTRRRGEIEILPPTGRSTVPAPTLLAPVQTPGRVQAGDLFLRPLIRYDARSRQMTYSALGGAMRAEADATQAAADLARARTDRALARAEYDELPERIAQERYARRLGRFQEIRNLEHEIALEELEHQVQFTRKSADLMQAETDLTLARANCTAARHRLADATQALGAQLKYGDRHYELMWERKIGEETLHVEEQRAVLLEHRERIADRTAARLKDIPGVADFGDDPAGEAQFTRIHRVR